ncbi:MAG: lipoyl(octanoyl) transferase LipB [Chromatiales bacterium]|nr:lipoyl(octanoyl) transferase LipB [Chromatiales bacterium]
MTASSRPALLIRHLERRDYESVWEAMREFTNTRTDQTVDELWVVEHPPVFTLGQAGKPEHLLNPGDIPVINCDRGGQVTYHGPGQLVVYLLINLKRAGLGVRQLVTLIEQAIITQLNDYGIEATAKPEAPGVYVNDAKIAALGLRVRRGCSYHGLSFNIDMDLEPFQRINPCGYPDLQITQLADLGIRESVQQVAGKLNRQISRLLDYNLIEETP